MRDTMHIPPIAGGITNKIYFNKKHLLGVSATSFITVISGHCMSCGRGGIYNYQWTGVVITYM